MNANMDNSEIKATVLPVSDEGLRREMRQYWKELKKWLIIGIIVCASSLFFAVIGTLLFVRASQSHPQIPSFSQTRFFQQTPQFPQTVFFPNTSHSQITIRRNAAVFYFKLAIFVLLCGLYPLVMVIINDYKLMVRYWRYIGPKKGCTAGQMAGFQFIPLFGFYWQFVAIWELAKKLNALGANHVSPQLALAFCIVNCCTVVATPILKLGTYIASIVLFFMLFEQFNKAFTEPAET